MSKKILVVGGGIYQIPVVKRIIELGHEAYVIDGNKDAPAFFYATTHEKIDVIDKKKCLDYAIENNIDAVLTYGATVTLPTVSYIANMLSLPGLCEYASNIASSKALMKSVLLKKNISTPPGGTVFENFDDALRYNYDFPIVIKPCDGSGSKGISVVHSKRDLEHALKYAFENARFGQIYYEKFVEGNEYTIETFVNENNVFVYAILKTTFLMGDNSVSYGHCNILGENKALDNRIEDEVKKAIRALKVDFGSVNFDVIVDSDGKPSIIDVGFRVGQNLVASHIVPYSRGVSELDNIICQSLGLDFDPRPKYNKYVATRLLIYNSGFLKKIKNFNDLIGNNGVLDIVQRKKEGDYIRPYTDKSDTCGWVVCIGDSPYDAEFLAEKAKEKLRGYFIIE